MAELEQVDTVANPIGDRLKAAREAQGLHLDDIAAKTRVPIRHLLHIEKGEWDQLPALTYSIGFARAYATAVGLNAAEIGTELRSQLSSTKVPTPAYYEPADPARVPPRWLALVAAVVAIVLVAGYFVWRSDALSGGQEPVAEAPPAADTAPAPPADEGQAQAAPAAAGGPVVLTATDDVWVRVYEAGGPRLYEATMKAGDRYEVPASAARPQIVTGRPNALQVMVGSTRIPPLGPPEKSVADVSLLAADLLGRGAPPSAVPASTTPTPAPAPRRPASGPAPAAAQPAPLPPASTPAESPPPAAQ